MAASIAFLLLLEALPISAHTHTAKLTEQELNAPVDSILWIHMALQVLIWGVVFPTGMVLGITRSRWHVPLQVSTVHKNPSLSQVMTPINGIV